MFLPVLDAPQHLQLHVSIDLYSSLPFSVAVKQQASASIFWLDRDAIGASLDAVLSTANQTDDVRARKLAEIKQENWDLFLRVLADGSVVLTAIAVGKITPPEQQAYSLCSQNIDRKPPTLLRQFTLQHSSPLTALQSVTQIYLVSSPTACAPTLISSPPLTSHTLSPLDFFESAERGLEIQSRQLARVKEEDWDILGFVRTPDGRGLGVSRSHGGGDVWRLDNSHLVRSGSWQKADLVVVLDGGMVFASTPLCC